jgi:hypothetical protein
VRDDPANLLRHDSWITSLDGSAVRSS